MDQRLIDAAQADDIEALYNLIAEDPFVLQRIDQVPFMQTPLHVAISANKIHFAKEITSLMPSFASKQNQHGYSPMHLASATGQVDMVKEFLAVNANLGLLKGREKRTPLHCAAMAGSVDVIDLLLDRCPKSFVELTIRKETALHLAVKNDHLEAFKLLLEWLKKLYDREIDENALQLAQERIKLPSLAALSQQVKFLNKKEFMEAAFSFAFTRSEGENFMIIKNSLGQVQKEEPLNWKDEDGNTVLHLATLRRQYEMIEMLLSDPPTSGIQVEVNAQNADNLSALDISLQLPRENVSEKIESIFRHAGAVTASQILTLQGPQPTASEIPKRTYELKGHPARSDLRSGILIGAVLIAVVCVLIGVNPPGGVWQGNYKPDYNTTIITEPKAGTAILATESFSFHSFTVCSIAGFFGSLSTISVLLKGSPLRFFLLVALAALSAAYLFALALITPETMFPSLLSFFLSSSAMVVIQLVLEAWFHRKRQSKSQTKSDEDYNKGSMIQLNHHVLKA